jgi:hypothetical protein
MSDQNQNIYEQIARMKYESALRQQNQVVREAQAIFQDMQETEQAAAEALQQGDKDTATYLVEALKEKEQELAHLAPQLPQPRPQLSQAAANFLQLNQSYRQRHGQLADRLFLAAHQCAVKAGYTPDTPAYFKNIRDRMELYAKDSGAPYDSKEQMLTPAEAAKISGLSADEYNRNSRAVHAAGKFSWQQKT